FILIQIPRPPNPTLFPYTTLFRSLEHRGIELTPCRFVERTPCGLEVPIDRQRAEPGEVVTRVVHLRRMEERIGVRVARHGDLHEDRKSTRLNSSHVAISYAVFCLK